MSDPALSHDARTSDDPRARRRAQEASATTRIGD
jgi:hypothetical protein